MTTLDTAPSIDIPSLSTDEIEHLLVTPTRVVRSEWMKMRTLRSTWLTMALVAVTAAQQPRSLAPGQGRDLR